MVIKLIYINKYISVIILGDYKIEEYYLL